ncbi:3-oxoacyl-ACP synthase [Rhizobacter sp. OV335]|uniref:3-oxoacyl-ACP synthase n=1 Tax=Rhizobacter sp. OV335 TaxID=1500264 RepID=UPI000918E9AB|nr:3-oxoacyl-ACP synthase [Rhizobacter sp. OV335]SHM38753.1 3-oxoacyl-[acyl-carrier-protein] synthase-1 [Rhizobacter sp. OV335]
MVAAIAVRRTGLVTSVGLDAGSACAAIRAKVTNPVETRFTGRGARMIVAHEVSLEKPWRGLAKLAQMAAMAIDECLEGIDKEAWAQIPLLLCVADPDRPGRLEGIDGDLFTQVCELLGARFASTSAIVAHGKVGTAVALSHARQLLEGGHAAQVLMVGTDSLLRWPTLQAYDADDRLLKDGTSDGFMPAEASAAVLVGPPGEEAQLVCTGIGFGVEPAPVHSEAPLRAEGLSHAIRQALVDAGKQMHELDFRIADVSGEQYYFKEAALAVSRTMRQRKEFFDIWHPAESIGETGAAIGLVMLAVVDSAFRKGHAPGPFVLAHFSNDGGPRAAVVLHWAAVRPQTP